MNFQDYKPSLSEGTAMDNIAKDIHDLKQALHLLWQTYNAGTTLNAENYSKIESIINNSK